ncbi:MAG TPA: thioredoxin domain-containing protein [Terracidiphilus sp.]|nr:thioredoxin domain-containing protein [Terracidiphilus sp.]
MVTKASIARAQKLLFRIVFLMQITGLLSLEPSFGEECKPPDAAKVDQVLKYEMNLHHIPSSVKLSVLESAQANRDCYWGLRFASGDDSIDFSVYLSPDGKYIAETLHDLEIDASYEDKARWSRVAQMLKMENAPSLGPPAAPVTVVEFGDYECPFCRQMAEIIKSELSQSKDIHFIYRNFPLERHPWALAAARMGACVAIQDRDEFWRLHDFFFANQNDLTEQNIDGKVHEFLAFDQGSKVDVNRAEECFRSQLAVDEIERDRLLGKICGVHGTPTLFINGRRYAGVKDATELRNSIRLVRDAESGK